MRRGFDWQGWLIPGAGLVIAGLLAVYTFGPSLANPAPSPSPSPSVPSASPLDEHEVATDDGVIDFRLVGGSIVVRRLSAGAATELGRATLPAMASAPPGASQQAEGTATFAMVCPSSEGDERFVFGHLDTARPIDYSGPESVGHGASDGLFLFALAPGAAAGPIDFRLEGEKRARAGMSAKVFDLAKTDGTRQPSGCFVSG